MKKYSIVFIIFLIIGIGITFPQQVKATSVTDAVVELTPGLDPLSKLVIKMLLDQIFGDHRGAATDARVRTKTDPQGPETATFFGDTGLVISDVSDDDGAARAEARNKLRGKVVKASTSGEEAAANAGITWKGDTKFSVDSESTKGGDPEKSDPLPDPEEIVEAFLVLTYEIGDISADIDSTGSGSFEMSHVWSGVTSFEGSVHMITDDTPEFTGDLAALSSEFVNTENEISATNFTITDTVKIPIDYSDFFSSGGEVTTSFSGSMSASSEVNPDGNGGGEPVPEPTTMLLLGSGLVGLVGFRRKFRKR